MKLAVRLLPFHRTVEVETKLVPLMVNVNPEPPAVAEGGESEAMDGTALLVVKVDAGDAPPPGAGLTTVTLAVPPVAMSAAVIAAVSCVPEA